MKTKLPKARMTEIVEQNLENELMLYNLTTSKMYSLNETSKVVFKACNGTTTFDDLKREHNYIDEIIAGDLKRRCAECRRCGEQSRSDRLRSEGRHLRSRRTKYLHRSRRSKI